MPPRVPKLRRHSNGRPFVHWRGKRHFRPFSGLAWGSPELQAAYREFLRTHVLAGQPAITPTASGVTVEGLLLAYLDHAQAYYPPGPSSEYHHMRRAAGFLLDVARGWRVDAVGPNALRAAREQMVAEGLSRTYCNALANRIRRIVRWGVSRELVPPHVLVALQTVEPLRAGRTDAQETTPRTPVDAATIEATADAAGPVIGSAIRWQWLTGVRSANVVGLTPEQITDREADVWWYRPAQHKRAYAGTTLLVPVGPRAQEVISPLLERAPSAACFSPREAARWHQAQRTAEPGPQLHAGLAYSVRGYRQAVRYAAARAGVPPWTPHQLRHARATLLRERLGIEAAQAVLGHAAADTTAIYSRRLLSLAADAARKLG